jgi:serine/threonine protein kinase
VNAHGRFNESEASTLFLQLVDAIEHTHNAGFVNRDIKLDNILIKDGRLVVGDWGFASTWSKDKKHVSSVGSLKYCSPEIVNGRPYVGPEVDVWSLGVVLYSLITGRLPFNGATVRTDISAARFNMPSDASEELRLLLSSMLCSDPSKRATISDVKTSAWMVRFHPHLLRLRTPTYKVQRRSSGSTLRRSDPTRSWDRARNDAPIVSVPAV